MIYTQDFSATWPPTGWLITNAGSGNDWTNYSGGTYAYNGSYAMVYLYHSTNAANTWAFTQGVSMTAGNTYKVEFYQRVRSGTYPENMKVTVGNAQTVGSQTTTLLTLGSLTNTTYTNQISTDYVCPSSGTYYFAFNCYSAADMWELYVDNVRIYETVSPCNGVISIVGCGSGNSKTYTGGGAGVWNTNYCGFGTPGIEQVYSFVAPTTGTYTLAVTAASGYVDYGWRASSCASTTWNCLNDINATCNPCAADVPMAWTAGTTYYILLDDENSTTGTHTFYLNCPAPANDNCAGTSLTVYGSSCGGATTGNVQGATQTIPAILCNGFTGTANDDIWYSFVATATSHDITVVGTASFDAIVDLRSGACNGSNIACADATFDGGTEVINATGLTVSSTYFVRVYDYDADVPATTTFTVCVTTPCTAPGATTLSSHSNTTTSITWNWNAASNATGYDISYDGAAWTANGAGTTYIKSSGITANTQHRLNVRATNACGTGTAMGDQYFYSSQNTPTNITFSGIVGNSITATANGTFPNQASGSSGVYIRNSTAGTNSGLMTATTSWASGGLTCGTTYSFYAKAYNGDGDVTTEIGPTNQATTACPGTPTLTSPFNNYRKAYNIDLSWSATPANLYRLQVDDDPAFGSMAINTTQAGAIYTIIAGLTNQYTYYWRVQASNDGGTSWGSFSAIRSFTVWSGQTDADWYQNSNGIVGVSQFKEGTGGGTDTPVISNDATAPNPSDNGLIQTPP